MHTTNLFNNYLENEVQVADPLKLVSLLYRGAIDSVSAARSSLRSGDIAGRSRQISKASAILNELALGLDHAKGGEISRSLAELYDYIQRRLNEANFKQIDLPLAEVERLLNTLAGAWQACPAPEEAPVEYRPLSMTA